MKTSIQSLAGRAAVAGITSFVYVSSALAVFGGPEPSLSGIPGGASHPVRDTILKLINAVLNFVALIAVVIIIIAGIRLIISQGEDEAKDKAKKTIFYAIAGLLVILFAKIIVGFVTNYVASQI